MSARQYDIVIWGATGYTGALAAKHIARCFPTDITWAIAGRSAAKLRALADACASINADRPPAIEIAHLDADELAALARKTRVLVSTVGPYARYGEPAVRACAENGTHYFDVTGEAPWVMRMRRRYEARARETGAVLIAQAGIESVPSDMLTWVVVTYIREKLGLPTREVVVSMHEFKAKPSGGTLATVSSLLDHFSVSELARAGGPFANSPLPGPAAPLSAPWYTRYLGIRRLPFLGQLTTFIGASANTAVVERSWGLFGGPEGYGPRFRYAEYLHVGSVAKGLAVHFATLLAGALLLLPFVRWAMKNVGTQPGEGAAEEETQHDRLEVRALGVPDGRSAEKVCARIEYQGGLYALTGIFVAQAALTLLRDEVAAKEVGGGFLTPAMLGNAYVERLEANGFRIETELLRAE